MNREEENWFDTYTWNGDPGTIVVSCLFKKSSTAKLMAAGIEKYFKQINLTDTTKNKTREVEVKTGSRNTKRVATVQKVIDFDGWLIDMSDKTFTRTTRVEINRRGITVPSAYPSQIQPFMAGNRGSLNGHRFGI